MIDYYKILRVSPDATKDELEVAYKYLPKNDLKIEIAKTLFNRVERAKYDRYLSGKVRIKQMDALWGSYPWKDTVHSSTETIRDGHAVIKKDSNSTVIYLLFAGFVSALLMMGDYSGLSFLPYLNIGACLIWFMLRRQKLSSNVAVLPVLWATGIIYWVWGFSYLPNTAAKIVVTSALMGSVLLWFRMNKLSRAASLERSKVLIPDYLTHDDMLTHYQFGTPGNLENSQFKFGYENVFKGELGEQYTSHLLQGFKNIPGVRVFHGLKFPGSAHADVDHAILSGDNLIFIDSKQWSSGEYSWGDGRTIYQKSSNGWSTQREIHMHSALVGYHRILPKRLNIYTFILIHGENIAVRGNPDSYGIRITNTDDGIREIGQLLHDGAVDGSINNVIMGSLVGSLK